MENLNVPELEEAKINQCSEEELLEEVEKMIQEENRRLKEENSLRYTREETDYGFVYRLDTSSGQLENEDLENIDEDFFQIETEIDMGKEILYNDDNEVVEIDMGPFDERESYKVIIEPEDIFDAEYSALLFRNEKGDKKGLIEWNLLEDTVMLKNLSNDKEDWKYSCKYREKQKLELIRDIRSQNIRLNSAIEGKEYALKNPDSSSRKAQEFLIDRLCPILKESGAVPVQKGIKRLGSKGPKYGNLLQEFQTAVNRFELKVENKYEMDPDKISVNHSNNKIIYEE